MLGVSTHPAVILATPNPEFVHDFKTSEGQWVFVVGEVGPNPTSRGLVKMPVGSLDSFYGEFDARSAIPHVDIKGWKRSSRLLTVVAFKAC